MPAFNSISPAVLARRVGTQNCPTILDVRIEQDFQDDPFLIPTAFRWPHASCEDIAQTLQGAEVIVVCQKGLKLSHGAAALLRYRGVNAQVLEGGMFAWNDGDHPRISASAIGTNWNGRSSTWVTRQRPKIDRIACAWLIRRFVDPDAIFLFVPSSEVDEVAIKFKATAFDTPNALWTHSGDLCTFDSMVQGFCLQDQALDTLAKVVRAADTDRHDLVPQAAGLLAISVGLSRSFKSDLEQLDAGMTLYDALYRWARDGQNETHSWPERHGQ